MSAKTMADYLPELSTADYTTTILSILPQGTFQEEAAGNVLVRTAEDGSEERVELGGSVPIYYVNIMWDLLTASDFGDVLDFWADSTKGRRGLNTFLWAHPTDGYTYVVRWESKFTRTYKQAQRTIESNKLRILGYYIAP